MCNPIAAVMAITAIAGGAQQSHMANKQQRAARQAEERQNALARQQADKRQAASGTTMFDVDESAGGSDLGLGNTFLTGAQGVSNDQLNLGGVNTKLGG